MGTGMEFKAGRAELVAALESVRHVVDRKGWKPALANCRFRAHADGLDVVGTDLSTWINARVAGVQGVGTIGEGSMLVPLHDLLDFLKACEGEVVTVSHRPEVVAVVGRKATAEVPEIPAPEENPSAYTPAIPAQPEILAVEGVSSAALISTSDGETLELPSGSVEEYPVEPVEVVEERARVGLPGAELARMLGSTVGSASREVGRYAMHGIMLEARIGAFGFRALATDGRRLAVATGTGCSLSGADAAGLLPRGAAEIVGKILAKNRKASAGGVAEVSVDAPFGEKEPRARMEGVAWGEWDKRRAARSSRGYFVRFALPCGVSVASRVLEGEFPRVDSVIPPVGSATVVVRLPVAETLKRLKLVGSACASEARAVRVSVGDLGAVVSATSHEKKSSARIAGAVVEKGEGTIAVNPGFLADALSDSGEETVTLGFRDGFTPMRIDGGAGYFAVLMPVTVDA